MKYILLTLLSIHTLYANESDAVTIHSSSVYLIMLFLLFALMITYAYFLFKCNKQKKTIEAKEAKIASFEKQLREDESTLFKKDKEVEQEIFTLKHTISDLERKMQEGTKNQVVAKIEALEKKRQNVSTL